MFTLSPNADRKNPRRAQEPSHPDLRQTGLMLGPYRQILSIPGALRFSAAGLLARLPMSMIGMSIILMVQSVYGDYSLAGAVSAVYIVVQAIASPQIARLVDKHGQAKIMVPAVTINIVGILLMATFGILKVPSWMLFIPAVWMGLTFGSIGAMVRSRWSYVLKDPREVHTAFSLEATLDEIVFVIGPPAATLLAVSVWAPSGLFVAALAFAIGGALFLRQRSTEPPPAPHFEGRRKSVLRSGGLVIIAVIFFFVGGIFGATDIATVAFTEEQGVKDMAGVVLAIFALGSGVSGFAYGSRHWVSAAWKRFAIGVVALGLGVCMFFVVTSVPMLALAMFIVGLTISPTLVTGNHMIRDFVDEGRLTEGLTWCGTAMGFGVSLGSWMGGTLVQDHGSHWGFGLVIVMGLLTVLTTFVTLPLLRGKSHTATMLRES